MSAVTSLFDFLFSRGQTYESALIVPCVLAEQLVEAALDDSLSSLEGDNARLAKKQVAIDKEHGSVKNFVEAVQRDMFDAPLVDLAHN